MGGCCGGHRATLRLILGLYAVYAQEVSVERENDLLGLRIVAWACGFGECGRACSSKKEVNAAEPISGKLHEKDQKIVCTF